MYVANLAKDLKAIGVNALVAAPAAVTTSYRFDGIEVHRFAVEDPKDISELYGAGNPLAADQFAKILDTESPDLVHLHAVTAGVSLRTVRVAKARGIPVAFTYHTPTVTCQRGTLLHRGKRICDGEIKVARCAGCVLNDLGVPMPFDAAVGTLPPAIGRIIGKLGLQGGIWTALRLTELLSIRRESFQAMMEEVDHVIAVCDWVQHVLVRNGVPANKLSLSRQGVNFDRGSSTTTISDTEIIKIAFLGRLDPTKGVHVLLEAMAAIPDAKIRLDIFGISQGRSDYSMRLRALAGDDPRIAFHDPIAQHDVIDALQAYDFLAVPSQWMETGPLVALEAFAAGVPVIGWDMGGVRELVRHDVDGLLVRVADTWAGTLQRICDEPKLRARLKAGIRAPKKSSVVANEMFAIYRTLIERPDKLF